MERLILPIFVVFGFFGSLFFDTGNQNSVDNVTQTGKADLQGDS